MQSDANKRDPPLSPSQTVGGGKSAAEAQKNHPFLRRSSIFIFISDEHGRIMSEEQIAAPSAAEGVDSSSLRPPPDGRSKSTSPSSPRRRRGQAPRDDHHDGEEIERAPPSPAPSDESISVSETDFLLPGRPSGRELAPVDKHNLVWIAFYILGMGTLLPWNFFISVNSFWEYKFRNVTCDPGGCGHHLGGKTDLQTEFFSYLAIASNVPNAIFVILNALVGQRVRIKYRLLVSLGFIIVFFFIVLYFTLADSDAWQEEFLVLILTLVVLINSCTAVFQVCCYLLRNGQNTKMTRTHISQI